jgi:hypothetical protein
MEGHQITIVGDDVAGTIADENRDIKGEQFINGAFGEAGPGFIAVAPASLQVFRVGVDVTPAVAEHFDLGLGFFVGQLAQEVGLPFFSDECCVLPNPEQRKTRLPKTLPLSSTKSGTGREPVQYTTSPAPSGAPVERV